MPAIVGPIKINSIGGGVVNFGDSFYQALAGEVQEIFILLIMALASQI
jgi:spore germination protein PF